MMETRIKQFTVRQLISALQRSAKHVHDGLDAPVRLLDWEMNHENIRTLQVCGYDSEVLIRFEPNECEKTPAMLTKLRFGEWHTEDMDNTVDPQLSAIPEIEP